MRKNVLVLLIGIFFVSFLLVSCDKGGIEGDVKEFAEKLCECEKMDGDEKMKCLEEFDKMEEEIEKKVKELDEAEQDKLQDLYEETLKNCLKE